MKCRTADCENENDVRTPSRYCDACQLRIAQEHSAQFFRRRALLKTAARVRAELLFLEKLATAEPAYPLQKQAAAELRRVESRLADAVTHLRETRNRIRKEIRNKWTKAQIDAAIAATAKAEIDAAIAATESASKKGR